MSFLKKIFGKKDPVEEMRQFHAAQDWVSLLHVTKSIAREELDAALQQEVEGCEQAAGDALSSINLDEGRWAQKNGNLLRAREDFQLALEQACSEALRQEAEQALAALAQGEAPTTPAAPAPASAAHAGCSTCAPASTSTPEAEEADIDQEARIELLLATMEPKLAPRYQNASPQFLQAWLATQDGEDALALRLFDAIPPAERNALFLFEHGSLLARSGKLAQAQKELHAALTTEPELFSAFAVLTEVLAASEQIGPLEKMLKESLAAQRFGGFCWARLAEIHVRRNELEPALAAGLKALDEGEADPPLMIMCAQLLERDERFDEAEALLQRLPGGGCGGGAHPMLAEFWLRRGTNVDRALESFKGAMRQEQSNPRWLLRISQVYLAKGWKKQAAEQIERLMSHGGLPEELKSEVEAAADACR
ncbi:MAG: hypothetical protein OET90_00675 [Desulfuromonadales bacterium]|nr:hypothetical protein [Desulfuromonadales bacterium]